MPTSIPTFETSPERALAHRQSVLVEAEALALALQQDAPPLLLAVRPPPDADTTDWRSAARIPGAIDSGLASDFAAPSDALRGSRPLPDPAALQAFARRVGLRADRPVVVYDHVGGLQAARAWWVLRWAGLPQVRVLDGGFAAWRDAGLPTSTQPVTGTPSDITLHCGQMPELDADAAQALSRRGLLLDSRIRPNYEGGPSAAGEAPRGHIPGAVSLPAPDNLDSRGRFRDAAGLQALYAAAGVGRAASVGVYCGAGVSAAHHVLALASLGIEIPMYVGSWSAWSADAARPVARGPTPG